MICKLDNLKAEDTAPAVIRVLRAHKARVHTITMDNGKVFRVARYDDQQGIAAVALPCFEEQLGFVCAFVHARAGADDDGSCADAFFKGGGKRTQVVGGRDVVFGVAADVDMAYSLDFLFLH